MKNYAVILAGGSGNRMNMNIPKAFIPVEGKPLWEYCFNVFSNHAQIHHIVIVVPDGFENQVNNYLKSKNHSKVIAVCTGGNNRFYSSRLGISQIADSDAKVLIHDAARPFISELIITECLNKLDEYLAVNLLAPVPDSLVEVLENKIVSSPDRSSIRQVQTPQGFRLSTIRKAHELALMEGQINTTDDFSLVDKYNPGKTSWIAGNRLNFKITWPEDLLLAQAFIKN
jgi:2-C-methyl-D-erythritol 4-phosphate cytidylyltransferase